MSHCIVPIGDVAICTTDDESCYALDGTSTLDAESSFDTPGEAKRANGLITLVNMGKNELTLANYTISAGIYTSVPEVVQPGYGEAMNVRSLSGLVRYSEGKAAWYISTDRYCAIYWRIEDEDMPISKGHILGLGCSAVGTPGGVPLHEIQPDLDGTFVKYVTIGNNEFVQDYYFEKFCSSDLCLVANINMIFSEGTADNAPSKLKIYFHLVPKLQADLAPRFADFYTQEKIDEIIAGALCMDGESICNNGGDNFVINARKQKWEDFSVAKKTGIIVGASVGGLMVIIAVLYTTVYIALREKEKSERMNQLYTTRPAWQDSVKPARNGSASSARDEPVRQAQGKSDKPARDESDKPAWHAPVRPVSRESTRPVLEETDILDWEEFEW